MHNPRILIGFVYRLRTLGHDALSKMMVKFRDGKAICKSIRGIYKTVGIAVEKRGGVARFVATINAAQSSPCQGNTNLVEALGNFHNLTLQHRFL